MPGLVFLVIHLTISIGMGWLVVSRLDPHGRLTLAERFSLSPLVGYVIIYFFVFAIAIVRLDVWSMAPAMIVMGVVAAIGLRSMPFAQLRTCLGGWIGDCRANPWLGLLVIVACAVAATSLLQGMAPPNDYDSLMYHISGPRFDVERGYLDMPWNRALSNFFFPALIGNQSRLALVLSDAGAAQMIQGMTGIIAGVLAVLLMRRLGYGRAIAVLAAVIFLTTRVVVWEMGTVEVEVALAAFLTAAILVYAILRKQPEPGLSVMFGIMVGAMILTKFHGLGLALAFGPIILWDIWQRRSLTLTDVVGPAVAFMLFVPHGLRSYLITQNPIFPIFNNLFDPASVDLWDNAYQAYGIGHSWASLFLTSWFMFIEPMKYFDGMIFGLPIFLALAPLVFLEGRAAKRWLWFLPLMLVYYVLWQKAFGQQVRFLLPLMPLLAGLSAAGAAVLWRESRMFLIGRAAFVTLAVILVAGQSMFVGIYSLLRLPVALGFMSPLEYHRNTPTLNGAHFESCSFIQDNLKPGERYYSATTTLSYYCPQSAATTVYFEDEARWWLTSVNPPEMAFDEFVRRFEEAHFRFFLMPTGWISRRNLSAEEHIKSFSGAEFRLGFQLLPLLASLQPVFNDGLSAVYDGAAVLEAMKRGTAQIP